MCAIPSLIAFFLSPPAPGLAYTMLLLVTNVLVARSLYVPSPPLHTLRVCLAALALPLVAAASRLSSVVASSVVGSPSS